MLQDYQYNSKFGIIFYLALIVILNVSNCQESTETSTTADDDVYDGLVLGVGAGVVFIVAGIGLGIFVCFIRKCTKIPE